MAESILSRAQRLVSAGAGNLLDAAEQASGASLLREAVREMDRAIERLHHERRLAEQRLDVADREIATTRTRITTLDEQARFALEKGREDLAERAIAERIDSEQRAAAAEDRRSAARAHGERLDAQLADAAKRRAQMDRLAGSAVDTVGLGPSADVGIARAEEMFHRARAILAAQQGTGIDAIEELRREDRIAAGLAELREGAAKKARRGR